MTLGGPKLKEMRELAGFPGREGRERFAKLVGVERRTLEGWESSRGEVPKGKVELVRKVLEGHRSGPTLDHVSNIELISALADRLAKYEGMERDYRELVRRLELQDTEDHGLITYPQDAADTVLADGNNSVPDVPTSGWGPGPVS